MGVDKKGFENVIRLLAFYVLEQDVIKFPDWILLSRAKANNISLI